MQCMGGFVVLCLMFGLVSCELHHRNLIHDEAEDDDFSWQNHIILDNFETTTVFQNEGDGEVVDYEFSSLNDDVFDKGETFIIETTTEFVGIDSNGCDRELKKQLEERCDDEYNRVSGEAQYIGDHLQKMEVHCCALEDFEKCSLRAFEKANCEGDKAALRENMKAARLFLVIVANVTCSDFRGQCAHYATASSSIPSPIPLAFFVSIFVTLTIVTAL